VFKEGEGVKAIIVSGDGSRVLMSSLGVFAGTESGSDASAGPYYELSRTPSGWMVAAGNPSASEFPSQALLGVRSDLRATLWLLHTGVQSIFTENLYLRAADGSLVEIGPVVPPAAAAGPPAGGFQEFFYNEAETFYDGASTDLSHVLFTITGEQAPLWPGDTSLGTQSSFSLYEYSGTGNAHPELVGVSDGSTLVNGKLRVAGTLISDCATFLGSRGDVYNAISADGASVFFKAEGHNQLGTACPSAPVEDAPEVGELFARLDQEQTVPVSEPSRGACPVCLVPATEAEGRREGVFAGASEDGSKVFFTTEQELLPGATGKNLYEYDFDKPEGAGTGRIVRVSTGSGEPEVQGVARVSEDGSHVYFVARGVLAGANGEGKSPLAGADNLYVFERDAKFPAGRLAFIAALCSGKEESGTVTGLKQCPSEASDSQDWSAEDVRQMQATPDGRFLVFSSVGDLTAGDSSAVAQIYEYDANSEKLVRVSVGRGAEGMESANTHASRIQAQNYAGEVEAPPSRAVGLAVSGDGASVMFTSRGALTAEAKPASTAGVLSVYEYHSPVGEAGGSLAGGGVFLLSDGVNALNAKQQGLDASGVDAFFTTADALVPEDVDSQYDLYDARLSGGFPAPDPARSAAAVGSPRASTTLGAPASALLTGTGSLASSSSPLRVAPAAAGARHRPRPCRRGSARSRRRCLLNARRARRAGHDRRAGR